MDNGLIAVVERLQHRVLKFLPLLKVRINREKRVVVLLCGLQEACWSDVDDDAAASLLVGVAEGLNDEALRQQHLQGRESGTGAQEGALLRFLPQ